MEAPSLLEATPRDTDVKDVLEVSAVLSDPEKNINFVKR